MGRRAALGCGCAHLWLISDSSIVKESNTIALNYMLPRVALLATFMAAAWPVTATEIWDGPLITFTKPDGADSMQPVYQDRITPNVWLTRKTTRGMFNMAVESSYTSYFSPKDTAWAYGVLADYNSLTYTDWEDWNEHTPPTMVDRDAVLHLITDDIYLSIHFTYWGASAGGFTYVRSTPSVPEPSGAVMIGTGIFLLGGIGFRRRHRNMNQEQREAKQPIRGCSQNFTTRRSR
jgi:hypothetical protein